MRASRWFMLATFVGLVAVPVISLSQEPIQTQEANTGGVVADVISVKAANDILTVKFRFRNPSPTNQKLDFYLKDCYLLDERNKKKYLPLKDFQGLYLAGPVAGKHDGGYYEMYLKPGVSYAFWVKFPLPVGAPEVINIVIPAFSPFENVKMQP